jgi:Helix-turn-helix.
MPKEHDIKTFLSFGDDVKSARLAMNISRRELAEMVDVDPRYLANIENSGALPSPPIFRELMLICKLPVERYFGTDIEERESAHRERIKLKLNLCSEKSLPIVEATIDGIIRVEKAEDAE